MSLVTISLATPDGLRRSATNDISRQTFADHSPMRNQSRHWLLRVIQNDSGYIAPRMQAALSSMIYLHLC